MDWSVTFEPLLATALLIGMAGVAAVLGMLGLFFRTRGAPLRMAALAALVLALFNPVLEREKREKHPQHAFIVVDRSASQSLDKRTGQADAALEALQNRLADFAGLEARVIEAGGVEEGTLLFDALRQELSSVLPDEVAGVFLITDGQIHDPPGKAAALGLDAPMHGLITGHRDELDLRIAVEEAPRFGLVGETVSLQLRAEILDSASQSAGMRSGLPQQVPLTIIRDGKAVDSLFLPVGAAQTLELEILHGGANLFQFQLGVLPGELTNINNTAFLQIEGIRENLRVLLVSGQPHVGERAWRNLLKSDASIDLVHFTILRPAEKQDGTPINELSLISFPTRELFSEKIDDFDLIILDRYERLGVLANMYFYNITGYIARGGGILVASGPEFAGLDSLAHTPLGAILPAAPTAAVLEQPFFPKISKTGERHPVTRGLAPAEEAKPDWSRWFRLIDVRPLEVDDKAPHTVMTGPDERPLLLLSRYGEGRVALLLSDHIWLWARGFEGGGPYTPLLRRLSHWLMQEPELEEEQLRARAEGRNIIVERQTMQSPPQGNEGLSVEVLAPDNRQQSLTLLPEGPGLYRGQMMAQEQGLYRIRDNERQRLVQVGPANPREFRNVLSTADLLAPLSAATGGQVSRLEEEGGFPRILPVRAGGAYSGREWMGLKINDASRLVGIDRLPLFAGFFGLALLLGLLGAMWRREGR